MEFIAPQPGSTRGTWWQPIHDYATSTFGHIVEVVDNASNFERQLFFAVLGITVVWFLFSTISFMVSFTRPITPIPFYHCEAYKEYQTRTRAGRPVYWADYPKLVDLQTDTFNQLLDESVDYEEFAQEVKNAERVSHNLIILVGMSDLSSKNEIAERLSKLVEEMRVAGRSLHSFGGKIQGAVDSYVSFPSITPQNFLISTIPLQDCDLERVCVANDRGFQSSPFTRDPHVIVHPFERQSHEEGCDGDVPPFDEEHR